MLKITDMNVFYGHIHAIQGISIQVQKNEIVSIIGSNGAGKSTLLGSIAGIIKKTSGEITFEDNQLPAHSYEIVKLGVILVPERRRIFPNLTVNENLKMGAYLRNDNLEIEKDLEEIYRLFPILKKRTKQYGGTLSGGEQQMLAIARGLMSKPKFLMLDEPSLGLAPNLTEEVFLKIKEINQIGITILLVEQNAFKALEIASRAYVLENGRITYSGIGTEMLDNPNIKNAYLGV
ncbi:MAG: ABC transporter ATP-binding protein [Candidatus Atribacteria bacterium]|nr:ABC transporter ATP-binding protein [Candidatus Atribacteria bacterium]